MSPLSSPLRCVVAFFVLLSCSPQCEASFLSFLQRATVAPSASKEVPLAPTVFNRAQPTEQNEAASFALRTLDAVEAVADDYSLKTGHPSEEKHSVVRRASRTREAERAARGEEAALPQHAEGIERSGLSPLIRSEGRNGRSRDAADARMGDNADAASVTEVGKAMRELRRAAVDGEREETKPERESRATGAEADGQNADVLDREIADKRKVLGPELEAGRRLESEEQVKKTEVDHKALASRIFDAMENLSALYEALSGLGVDMKTRGEAKGAVVSGTARSEHATPHGVRRIGEEDMRGERERDVAGEPHVAGQPTSNTETQLGQIKEAVSEPEGTGRGRVEEPVQKSETPLLVVPTSTVPTEGPTDIGDTSMTPETVRSSKARGSLVTSMLSILAGLVFVAAIGLLITGVVQGRNDRGDTGDPLYPPRGPAFV